MYPRNLNAHVERAIAQRGNENTAQIKAFSSKQLKSGNLSRFSEMTLVHGAAVRLSINGSTIRAVRYGSSYA